MSASVKQHAVTDEDLVLSRRDPAFRQQLLASSLDHLLVALARVQASEAGKELEPRRQIEEGVELAVKLAQMLQSASRGARCP